MTTERLIELFEKHSDNEYIEFKRIANKRLNRPDLHAFLLLDEMVPGAQDIVCCAEHDEIWLEVTPEDLAKVITEEQIIELTRCGVMYSADTESFHMFV